MTTIASQITSLTAVYSTVYSDADHRKHQSSASLAFVRGIHRDRWIPRTKASYAENVSIWWRHHDSEWCTYPNPTAAVDDNAIISVSSVTQLRCAASPAAGPIECRLTRGSLTTHCPGVFTAGWLDFLYQDQLQQTVYRADSRYAPSQWETVLLCSDGSHWLCVSLESALSTIQRMRNAVTL